MTLPWTPVFTGHSLLKPLCEPDSLCACGGGAALCRSRRRRLGSERSPSVPALACPLAEVRGQSEQSQPGRGKGPPSARERAAPGATLGEPGVSEVTSGSHQPPWDLQLSARILTHSTPPRLNATSFYTLSCFPAPKLEGVFSGTRCLPSIKKAHRGCATCPLKAWPAAPRT